MWTYGLLVESASKCAASASLIQLIKTKATAVTAVSKQMGTSIDDIGGPMKLLFVGMGVGYDQHGQDITTAAMRACRDAISSNYIPAFHRGD